MAVTRAEKVTELNQLEGVFKGADAAILLDYKGINVPQVTELRRELRKAKAGYRVVKNTLARRALKGTTFETLTAHFEGTTAIAYAYALVPLGYPVNPFGKLRRKPVTEVTYLDRWDTLWPIRDEEAAR